MKENNAQSAKGECPVRHNIGSSVAAIRRNGWENASTIDSRIGCDYQTPEQRRTDLYKSSASLIPYIVDHALAKRADFPPYGLIHRSSYDFESHTYPLHAVTDFTEKRPFAELNRAMQTTLQISFSEMSDDYYRGTIQDDPIKTSVLESFLTLAQRGRDLPSSLISRGIFTSSGTMTNLLELLPKIEEPGQTRPPSVAELQAKAKKSYPLITKLAGDSITVSPLILRELQDDRLGHVGDHPFNPTYFTFDDSGELSITKEFEATFRAKHDTWLGEHEVIGCPALYSSSIKRLWEWSSLIAQPIWHKQLDQETATLL